MNSLVKKEIRLLLPSFLIGIVLTFANGFLKADQSGFNGLIAIVSFGSCSVIAVFMALNSFGAEISSGTFSMLLEQPVSRHRIWRTKTLLLAAALFIGGFLWCAILYLRFEVLNPPKGFVDYWDIFLRTWVFLPVVYSGALWTVLLLRQMAAAFWFTLLTPCAIVMLIVGLWPEKYPDACEPAVIAVLLVYSLAGFWFARRLFMRAQDVAWTGGTITLPEMRWLKWWGKRLSGRSQAKADPREPQTASDIGSSVASPRQIWRPRAALFWKELQLHQVSLLCASGLLVMHLVVMVLRKVVEHPSFEEHVALEGFWLLWLVMPVLVGCAAVAEERKLGVMEGQLCLPVSRRVQFAIKGFLTLFLGIFLGGVMPILLETVARHLSMQSVFFKPENFNNEFGSGLVWFQISIVAIAAGLAWAGFFASTLARNFLQALSIAIATILSCILFVSLVIFISKQQMPFFGITLWHPLLPILFATPVIPATLLWLAYLNFEHFHENWHLWRRNMLGLAGALLFIVLSSVVIYNRAWEIFESAEPPHGPAIFSPANPPKLNSYYANLLVRLPDGRVWFNSLGWDFWEYQPSRWKELWLQLVHPLPKSAGPQQFIAGSNWVSATASRIDWWPIEGATNIHAFGYRDTVGIQPDGTLWISGEAKPIIWTGASMIRFGDETNWQQVVRSDDGLLLLKKDGTLWKWGTNRFERSQWRTNWPTVRIFNPRQIGTNSDWKEIFSALWNYSYARKTNGSIWVVTVDSKTEKDKWVRETNLDQVVFQTFSHMNDVRMGYVSTNGTLWICNSHSVEYENGSCSWQQGTGFLQVGKETNWLAVAVNWGYMVALKSDGSLWKWNFTRDSTAKVAKIPPTQLGIHSDWVGLTDTWMGTVSLAADGSLWLWPTMGDYYGVALLKSPKQPEFLGNVFGKSD